MFVTITMVDKMFVNTGAYLDYGGYGDAQNYTPASKANPLITLEGRYKEMSAKL